MRLFKRITLIIALLFATRAFAAGPVMIVDATGTATSNVATVNANKLATYDAGYINQIREGNIAAHDFVMLEGNNSALGTALSELSVLGTGFPGDWPSDGTKGVVLVSDDADDTAAGTGARTVIIRGHDAASLEVDATVTMDGATPVTVTTQLFFRVHELEVVTAGSSFTNEGLITASINGAPVIALQDGHSRSTEGRYHVRAGGTLYLGNAEGSAVGTNKNSTFHLFTRDTTITNAPFVLRQIWQAQAGGYRPNGVVKAIPEKTDVIIMGQGTAASNVSAASFQGWVED